MPVLIKRIYESQSKSDGFRILVDRLWPRGIKKADAHLDLWLKNVAPSNTLRKWFNHEPEKWEEFIKKYTAELKDNPVFEELKENLLQHKKVTLLFSAKDEEHNQAVALKKILER